MCARTTWRLCEPALNWGPPEGIKACAQPSGFLRTYSARIYFIVSNSSLACLHMPHPSSLVDDIRAPSYNREHGRLTAVSRTFGSWCLRAACSRGPTCQRGERSSDRLFQHVFLCRDCNVIAFVSSHVLDEWECRGMCYAVPEILVTEWACQIHPITASSLQ